ncbi:MAG TPA: class I SAM-dependent methyltransferase, partial [Candidatus Deferrimicrobiaceae bacterium]
PPCPVCGKSLRKAGRAYPVEELLALWAPVRFSRQTVEEHLHQSSFTCLYACAGCGLEIFFPKVIGTPRFYDELQDSEGGAYYVGEKWEFTEALSDARGAGSVVEVGCGPGNFLEKVSRFVGRAYGVEYNDRAIRDARARGHTVFGPDRDILEEADPADAVFAFHVLEHVEDPVGFLKGIARLVRSGGRIGLSVPNMEGPVRFVNPCASNMPPHHATRWRARTFRVLARSLDLRIERIAFEPLVAAHRYYYTQHWARRVARNSSLFHAVSRAAERFFDLYFRVLAGFGRESSALFRGQSLYVSIIKETS